MTQTGYDITCQNDLMIANRSLQTLITEMKYHCEVYKLSLKSISRVLKQVEQEKSASIQLSNTSNVSTNVRPQLTRSKFQRDIVLLSQSKALKKINSVLLKARLFINGYATLRDRDDSSKINSQKGHEEVTSIIPSLLSVEQISREKISVQSTEKKKWYEKRQIELMLKIKNSSTKRPKKSKDSILEGLKPKEKEKPAIKIVLSDNNSPTCETTSTRQHKSIERIRIELNQRKVSRGNIFRSRCGRNKFNQKDSRTRISRVREQEKSNSTKRNSKGSQSSSRYKSTADRNNSRPINESLTNKDRRYSKCRSRSSSRNRSNSRRRKDLRSPTTASSVKRARDRKKELNQVASDRQGKSGERTHHEHEAHHSPKKAHTKEQRSAILKRRDEDKNLILKNNQESLNPHAFGATLLNKSCDTLNSDEIIPSNWNIIDTLLSKKVDPDPDSTSEPLKALRELELRKMLAEKPTAKVPSPIQPWVPTFPPPRLFIRQEEEVIINENRSNGFVLRENPGVVNLLIPQTCCVHLEDPRLRKKKHVG